ncbi:ABC transporter substrate-binding protein [Sinomonas sp. JGH33]|uniref:ABC transporter substrate-binding protein n=1 Tax=Sinomonas terricola TaxID=3110330 RepID=A0ABU5TAS6_9MICC|nr:ABC transporter substrate-binding protein [Sinomonas sp. JGH33]MEA5456774.1 ABC transporter substrate-binding protein [Sinomonas sp. JGH33]
MTKTKILAAAVLAAALAGGATACSTSGTSNAGASAGGRAAYTFWDPYPQFDESAAWTKLVEQCGQQAGVTIKRTGYDTTDLTNKALLAGQQGNSADLLLVDNPVVSTLAQAGVLTSTDDTKLDTSAIQQNILQAGVLDGKAYGVPIGANTLALYYNKNVLAQAGVDVSTIKDWKSFTDALAKVKAAGKKGITFSAIGTEEGSFQFLPWFWGSGASLKQLDSSQGVDAVSLWAGWIKNGYAPNSVINNTQTTSWQEFATGDFAFGENGTWQLDNVKKAGIDYGILAIPGANGGSAAVPTGGEFMTIPVQKDTARYATSVKIAQCLTSTTNLVTTDNTLSYVAPTKDAQAQQVSQKAELKPWVDAVAAAKGRTSDNLGTNYPKISQQMWGAVQNALSGSQSPQAAMQAAQSAAAAATK